MLGQEIFLWSKQEITGFCNFLDHNPSKKHLVKRLHWAIGYGFPFTLDELQMALDHCLLLQELSLDIGDKTKGALEQSITDDAWRKERPVEKQHHLKKLKIDTRCPADYLEYLFYKYASIESLKMSIGVDKVFIEFYMQRVSYLISKVAKKDILFTYKKGSDGEKIMSMLLVWNKEAALYHDDASEDFRIRVRYAF